MDSPRAVALVTAVFIIGITLATGPLLGLSLTADDPEQFAPESGTIDATVVSTPEVATLDRAKFGVEKYYLRSPAVELQIAAITGHPPVAYEIEIEEIGSTRSSIEFLDSSFEGTYQLEFERAQVDAERVDGDEYNATLRVVAPDENRTLIETEIRIEVGE